MMGRLLLLLILQLVAVPVYAEPSCATDGIYLQVLGSGGPELDDQRASSAYLVWQDGRARILIDVGPGSMLRYEQSGAKVEDLDVVLLTHLHVDHSADLPALLKAAFFSSRTDDLAVYGPVGNRLMPDTNTFVQSLFSDSVGAYRYLSEYLEGGEAFLLKPHNVSHANKDIVSVISADDFSVSAVVVHHGPIPALAWRVDIDDLSISFSGDMNGDYQTLQKLAVASDVLVAHNAVPEGATGVARNLHMPPSVIGKIAAQTNVKHLVLSHRMKRTLGREAESEHEIRKHYSGEIDFAEDGQCFKVVASTSAKSKSAVVDVF